MARWLPPLTREERGATRWVEAKEGSQSARKRVVDGRGGQPAGKPASKPEKMMMVLVVMMDVVVIVGSPHKSAIQPVKRWWYRWWLLWRWWWYNGINHHHVSANLLTTRPTSGPTNRPNCLPTTWTTGGLRTKIQPTTRSTA